MLNQQTVTKEWFHSSALCQQQSHVKLSHPLPLEWIMSRLTLVWYAEKDVSLWKPQRENKRKADPEATETKFFSSGIFQQHYSRASETHRCCPGRVWGSAEDVICVGVAGGEAWLQSDWCTVRQWERTEAPVSAALCRWRGLFFFFWFFLSASRVPSGCKRRGHAALPGYKHNTCHRSSGLVDVAQVLITSGWRFPEEGIILIVTSWGMINIWHLGCIKCRLWSEFQIQKFKM